MGRPIVVHDNFSLDRHDLAGLFSFRAATHMLGACRHFFTVVYSDLTELGDFNKNAAIDERRAAEDAREILSSLTPSTPRTTRIIFHVAPRREGRDGRLCECFARSDGELCARGNGARAVCLQLDQRALTQEMLDRAKQAVEAWLNGLQ